MDLALQQSERIKWDLNVGLRTERFPVAAFGVLVSSYAV
jgi:hypothetical protein